MKVNSISASNKYNNWAFSGVWKERKIYNAADYHIYNKKVYIPDEFETPEEIAMAWKNETGLFPIDWVKKVNPFNQVTKSPQYGQERETEYSIKDKKYLPYEVLKASALLKNDTLFNDNEKVKNFIDIAELAMMEDNKEEAKLYEKKIVREFASQTHPRGKLAIASLMDEYKNRWGEQVYARDKYNPRADIFEDSDTMLKNINA